MIMYARGWCVLFLMCIWGQSHLAADWPRARGPHGDGTTQQRGLIENWSFPKEGPKKGVIWQKDIGGRCAPIVLGGRVFLNTATAHDPTDPREKIHVQEQVICWDAHSGKQVWRDVFNVFQTDISAERIGWASMAGDAETKNVYVHSVSGLLRCYSKDGTVVWERSLHEEFGKISGYGGRTQSPIVDEDRLIVGLSALNWGTGATPPPRQAYYAFDKRTGRLLWVSRVGGKIHDTISSTPIVREIGGVRMLIGGGGDGGCHAIHARTGEPLWSFAMSKRGVNTSPVAAGKFVYITHGEDNVDNLDFGRIQCIDAEGRGDITETHSVWRVDGIRAGKASPLVHDGVLYVMADTGVLHALDAQTGRRLWRRKLDVSASGSPVWADGKLLVTTPGGRVYILRADRRGVRVLSQVKLPGRRSGGRDEIYGSCSIADSKIFLTTRDRLLCLGAPKAHSSPSVTSPKTSASPQGKKSHTNGEIARLHLTPYEATLQAGQSVRYQIHAYDKTERLVEKIDPRLKIGESLSDVKINGAMLAATSGNREQAGTITAGHAGLSASARLRVFPPLPWKWDFETYQDNQVPPTWIRARGELRPQMVDGSVAMQNLPGAGRPSGYIWLGPPSMSGYTIQADVMAREQRRQMSNLGITAQRYNLILHGNTQQASIQSWAPQQRMAHKVRFVWSPGQWHTLKLRVLLENGKARVQGKVWRREEREPAKWTLEAIDPHPNQKGSPGLYVYSLAEGFFDNVTVTKGDEP